MPSYATHRLLSSVLRIFHHRFVFCYLVHPDSTNSTRDSALSVSLSCLKGSTIPKIKNVIDKNRVGYVWYKKNSFVKFTFFFTKKIRYGHQIKMFAPA